jgi:hypothetical protein
MGFTMIERLIDSVICLPFFDLFFLKKNYIIPNPDKPELNIDD